MGFILFSWLELEQPKSLAESGIRVEGLFNSKEKSQEENAGKFSLFLFKNDVLLVKQCGILTLLDARCPPSCSISPQSLLDRGEKIRWKWLIVWHNAVYYSRRKSLGANTEPKRFILYFTSASNIQLLPGKQGYSTCRHCSGTSWILSQCGITFVFHASPAYLLISTPLGHVSEVPREHSKALWCFGTMLLTHWHRPLLSKEKGKRKGVFKRALSTSYSQLSYPYIEMQLV